ncbi:hypothetical protein FIU85_17160 [Roseovarius sp. THAF8]|nr:hypothetical protein FIU85_17160 [Roseovarius sp. THAF8]
MNLRNPVPDLIRDLPATPPTVILRSDPRISRHRDHPVKPDDDARSTTHEAP